MYLYLSIYFTHTTLLALKFRIVVQQLNTYDAILILNHICVFSETPVFASVVGDFINSFGTSDAHMRL